MSNFMEFGFGQDDANIGAKIKKFKAEAGKDYRISFAWWPLTADGKLDLDAKTPRFIGAKRAYIKDVGFVVVTDPEMDTFGSPVREAIATIIIQWPTNSQGEVDKARLQDQDFQVLPWVFSADKYRTFAPIHKEFHMGKYDLMMSCTDTVYQKMTFRPSSQNLLRILMEKEGAATMVRAIHADVEKVARMIRGELGREMTPAQIRQKLSGGGPAPVSAPGAGKNGVSTDDLDAMMDGLLD